MATTADKSKVKADGKGSRGRIGGRGCPSCGGHDTEGLVNRGAQWCNSCSHRWAPCKPHCRGYEADIAGDVPKIRGCKDCGVPDKLAIWWPEAWRAVYALLSVKKMDDLAE